MINKLSVSDAITPWHAACGPVAQLDRVFDYESKGRGFESRRAHHITTQYLIQSAWFFFLSKQARKS